MLSALFAIALISNPLSQEVDQLVDAQIAAHPTMGLSVAVMKKGVVVDECYRGFANQATGVKVNQNTRFRLASISKTVTATLVMRAVDQGLIDLDADIRKYVPEWPDKGVKITMRQILAHRSGIRHYISGRSDARFEEMTSSDALKMFKDDPLLFAPGEKYSYSTHAFTLAVAALENVTGKKYPVLVREFSSKIGAPQLQCESLGKDWPANRSHHYLIKDGVPIPSGRAENLSWKYGGGGLECNAVDLAQYGRSVFKGGILKSASQKEMWTDPEKDGYGLGWDVSGDIRQHSGSQQGANSYLLIDTKHDVVIVVLSNTVPSSPGALAKNLLAAAIK
jgi:serine beta-lactamase-like protein LACTB, mitochondrial